QRHAGAKAVEDSPCDIEKVAADQYHDQRPLPVERANHRDSLVGFEEELDQGDVGGTQFEEQRNDFASVRHPTRRGARHDSPPPFASSLPVSSSPGCSSSAAGFAFVPKA